MSEAAELIQPDAAADAPLPTVIAPAVVFWPA